MEEADEQEVQSPLKQPACAASKEKKVSGAGASRQLDMQMGDSDRFPRKRKSKQAAQALRTPDLNEPVGSHAIVPAGLVNSRVSQLDTGTESSSGSLEETLKKQRRGSLSHTDRSAGAAKDSPRRAP